jgi:hypothetical protein
LLSPFRILTCLAREFQGDNPPQNYTAHWHIAMPVSSCSISLVNSLSNSIGAQDKARALIDPVCKGGDAEACVLLQ